MRLWTLIAIAPLLATTAACQSKWEKENGGHNSIPASGPGATRTYAATGFTGVELNGADDADVKIGANFSVTAEGDPKVLDQLEFQVVDGKLRISRKDRDGKWFENDHGAKIHIVMPKLTSAGVGGSGNISAFDLTANSGEVSIAGSGDIEGTIKGGAAVNIVGSGDVELRGGAKCAINTVGSGEARCS